MSRKSSIIDQSSWFWYQAAQKAYKKRAESRKHDNFAYLAKMKPKLPDMWYSKLT